MGRSVRKIVFVVPRFDCGGAERVSVTFAKQLMRAGNQVEFVNIGNGAGAMRQWLDVYDIPFVCLNRRHVMWSWQPLWLYLRRERPTYVYSSWRHVSIVLLLLGYVLPFRVIVREPTMPSNQLGRTGWKQRVLRKLMRRFYKRAYRIIAQTPEMKQEIMEHYRVSTTKVCIILNPIDADLIRQQIQGENPFRTRGVNYLAVGNLTYAKAYDVLVQAFALVLQEQPEAHLYIVGRTDIAGADKIQNMAESCEHHIHFEGFRSNPYVYMANCSVFVLSSRMEGCPNALLEACYLKKRVVATRCVPIVDQLVQDGVNGYLVGIDDSVALARALVKASELPEAFDAYLGRHVAMQSNILAAL